MSQAPDWSFTQAYEDDEDDGQAEVAPPPSAVASKKGRPALPEMQAAAREKVDNLDAMLEAARFLTTALDAHAICARAELKKVESRKPRAARAPKAPEAAPAPSKAALACEDAATSKTTAPRGVKRVRTASVPDVGRHEGGGGAVVNSVHYHQNPTQGVVRPYARHGVSPHAGVLGYKTE